MKEISLDVYSKYNSHKTYDEHTNLIRYSNCYNSKISYDCKKLHRAPNSCRIHSTSSNDPGYKYSPSPWGCDEGAGDYAQVTAPASKLVLGRAPSISAGRSPGEEHGDGSRISGKWRRIESSKGELTRFRWGVPRRGHSTCILSSIWRPCYINMRL